MRRYKAVVGVLLAAIATFLVSCGSGPAAVAPTYTPEKIAQLSSYVGRLEASRDRFPELLNYIEKDNWINVDNFTHGPLGQLRAELLRMSGQLLPADQPKAKALSEEILGHLQNIDEASQDRNYGNALSQYREFVGDFEALLSIVPEDARRKAIETNRSSDSTVYNVDTTIPEPKAMRSGYDTDDLAPALEDSNGVVNPEIDAAFDALDGIIGDD